MDFNYDDTFPLPAEVEREFLDHAGDDLTALAWLAERVIDTAPVLDHVGKIALISVARTEIPKLAGTDSSFTGQTTSGRSTRRN